MMHEDSACVDCVRFGPQQSTIATKKSGGLGHWPESNLANHTSTGDACLFLQLPQGSLGGRFMPINATLAYADGPVSARC